ncbi:MAG: imidazoleglycerol-phosphate dehydratase HisB [Thermoprotei archaeon]|jgi:imidazoleglycerol-phosphate dehydratase
MRVGLSERITNETQVKVKVNIDGTGRCYVNTGIKFLDHMIKSLAIHGIIDIEINSQGDLVHHIVEDVALTLGDALKKALNDRAGIKRFGFAIVPMDDALALVSVDLVQRPYSDIDIKLVNERIEDIASEDIIHFFRSLADSLQATIHVSVMKGTNDHHKVEASFKALAVALRDAWSVDPRRQGMPSSKGVM